VLADALLALADREIAAKAAEIERLQAELLDRDLRVVELEDELRKRGADIRDLRARLERPTRAGSCRTARHARSFRTI
jgi:predicted  nucleic acid-binding Zn-ribbon protein